MHKLLKYSDDELLKMLIERIASLNPRIKIGDKMDAPVMAVWKGKKINLDRVLDPNVEVLNLDFSVPHYKPPHELAQTRTIKLSFDEFENPEWSAFPHTYLHPYELSVPHRKWMIDHKPGDTVLARDDLYDASPLTLTEEHFKAHEYLIFRFASTK